MASTYTWSLQSGTLPPGTSLSLGETDLDITLSGTPTTFGTYNFTVRITNDISGAFDDQSFSVFIDENRPQLTPDLGGSIDQLFDSMANPQLVEILTNQLTLDATLTPMNKYGSLRKAVFSMDIGAGVNNYWVNLGSVFPSMTPNRWYLWRLSANPDTIFRVFLT